MKHKKGKLVLISGPSGCGKGTIIRELLKMQPDLSLSVSATTRAPRPGEIDGKHYHFISHERFREMIASGEFLEHAEYLDELYGTPIAPVNECKNNGKIILLEIEVQGAKQVMENMPDAITIFIVPPDIEELERRLRGRRTESEEKISGRIARAKLELEEKYKYDHIIVNDEVPRASEEILNIIR